MKDRKKIYGKSNIDSLKSDVKTFFEVNINRIKNMRLKRISDLKERRV
jgi:hypothetical protein